MKKILIYEADSGNMNLWKLYSSSMNGFEFTFIEKCEQAIKLANKFKFDLFISSAWTPELGCIRLLKEVKNSKLNKKIKALLFSAFLSTRLESEERQSYFDAGFSEIIHLPILKSDFINSINGVLELTK